MATCSRRRIPPRLRPAIALRSLLLLSTMCLTFLTLFVMSCVPKKTYPQRPSLTEDELR